MAEPQAEVDPQATEEMEIPSSDPPENDKDNDAETPKKNKDDKAFDLGDLVWAKMSSFPAWPGRIVKQWKNVKKPAGKKAVRFVFFFGTEDHAWVKEESLKHYHEHKATLSKAGKGAKFTKAIDAIEEAIVKDQANKFDVESHANGQSVGTPTEGQTTSPYHPPSDEDDDNDDDDIFLKSISKPSKDYSREPMAGKKKLNSSQTSSPSSPGKGSNSSSPFTKISSHLASPKKRGRPPKPMEDGETVTKKATPKKRPSMGGSTAVPGKKSRSDMSFLSLNLYNSFQAHLAQKGETTKKDIKPTEKKIGFIGLGLMGTGMAMNLIKAGHKVTVWNRTSEKCEEFVKAGATQAETVSDLVASCDITFSMVSDSEAVRAIVFGENGVLEGITEGKAFVDMSTVDIGTVTGVSEAVQARDGRFMEAPVCGSVQPAMEGSLIIIAAGDKELYDECESCFQAMGKKAFYLSDTGNAARMKLVINMIIGGVMCCFAEGMALADKSGLSQSVLLDILNLGSIANPLISGKGKAILANKYPPAFPLKYQQKDLKLALAMSEQVDQPLPVASAVNEQFKRAKNMGLGDKDTSAIYKSLTH
ncbi:putative oxidoreductase GLYR1 isoform X1 [Strongylocentrotus purpuratus]|uniref:Cytokine-like nuclear factor N-PAC n=1 Tax=Strongylocentrotus purpuratus TaxID=7668 RepID=A0A7M7NH57_STRPU|nr:putative oxidoreductase GLYR1 isoform X1 [Strongylocentrotus purpuratus]